jgi:hypothetical protein
MSWTIPLAILSGLAYLADNATVMGWVSSTPYPWGAAIGTGLGIALVIKRQWFPSAPTPTQWLSAATDPRFIDRVLKLAERKPEVVPDIIIKQRDGSELKISSDVPQPGDIPGGGLG